MISSWGARLFVFSDVSNHIFIAFLLVRRIADVSSEYHNSNASRTGPITLSTVLAILCRASVDRYTVQERHIEES